MGNKKKAGRASDHITFESDNEELRDEVDQFHDEKRKLKANAYRKAKTAEADEVLNVEGDISEEELDSDDSSDFDDDDDDDDVGISSNQWGRKRKDHYSTDYVDKDWGGMRDEEMEEAELEEQDALARQKELDKATAQLDDNFEDEPVANKQKDKIEKETKLEWSLSSVKKLNKDISKLVEEYSQRKDLMEEVVEPLRPVLTVLPEKSVLRKQLQMVIDVYSKLLLNIAFLLKEKSASFEKQELKDELLANHPVNEEYSRSKLMIKKVDAFLDKNSDVLIKLRDKVKEGADLTHLLFPEVSKKKVVPIAKVSEEIGELELEEQDEEELDENGKRKAPGSIAKNAKSTKKQKKKDKHAKVANRRKYKEIQKKVRSQVGKIRKETEKYTGEARGIRASTIKSVKLIA